MATDTQGMCTHLTAFAATITRPEAASRHYVSMGHVRSHNGCETGCHCLVDCPLHEAQLQQHGIVA